MAFIWAKILVPWMVNARNNGNNVDISTKRKSTSANSAKERPSKSDNRCGCVWMNGPNITKMTNKMVRNVVFMLVLLHLNRKKKTMRFKVRSILLGCRRKDTTQHELMGSIHCCGFYVTWHLKNRFSTNVCVTNIKFNCKRSIHDSKHL